MDLAQGNDARSSHRRRLILISDGRGLSPSQLRALRKEFDVSVVESVSDAEKIMKDDHTCLLLAPGDHDEHAASALATLEAVSILEHIGEGVGLVDASGTILWADPHLSENENLRQRFVDFCLRAIEIFNQPSQKSVPAEHRHSRKFELHSGEYHFELFVSPASADSEDPDKVNRVIGVLCDMTETRRLEQKIEALNTAGSELMKFDANEIAGLDAPRRLKLIEDKIVAYVQELLHFDNFEVRLLDRQTNQLKLVIAKGLNPLKIGEHLYASAENNGICGYVAATGESYLCGDVTKDPRYREGLDNAASSLTVPLKLHDQVMGVFNVESHTRDAFDENDLRLTEIFCRYIAIAMNILDLLLVERFTTNERFAQIFLDEMKPSLADMESEIEALRHARGNDPEISQAIDRLAALISRVHENVHRCAQGPKTVLAAEEELHRDQPDPAMSGRRVLVADDEDSIRERLDEILTHRGCEVVTSSAGDETIRLIEEAVRSNQPFDLVIADINMPHRNGYEVFRATKHASPNTPVILMTGFGYDPHHSIMRASQEGLHCFLFKPLRAAQLIEEVTKALKSQPSEVGR